MLIIYYSPTAQIYRLEREEALRLSHKLSWFLDGVDKLSDAAKETTPPDNTPLGTDDDEVSINTVYQPAKDGFEEGVMLVIERDDEEYPGVNNVALTPNEAYKLYVSLLQA